MNTLYRFHIGQTARDGRFVTLGDIHCALVLADRAFGGYTLTFGKGCSQGAREETIILECYGDGAEERAARDIRNALEIQANQETVLLVKMPMEIL